MKSLVFSTLALLPSVLVVEVAVAQGAGVGSLNDRGGGKVICKRSRPTGSRMDRKMCHTRSQWDAIEEDARRTAAESFTKPSIETRNGS